MRFNGEVHDGAHEGIVSPGRWDEAARLLAASARTKGWRGKQPATHLLTKGHLKCGRCGESMVPRTDHDSYVCPTAQRPYVRARPTAGAP